MLSRCEGWRGRGRYAARLLKELNDEFRCLDPDTVCAFVMEPVVGAAVGCVPASKGYTQLMKSVCDKYGALLILDEVMCGMADMVPCAAVLEVQRVIQ